LTGILCLGLMSSCSVEDHKEIREHTDQMLEALIRGSEEEAYAKVSHLCSRGEFSPIFSTMKEMLGSTDSYTLKPIGIQSRWENGVSSQTVRYLMITEENSFEVETSLSQGKLYGFHLYHNTTVPLSGSFGTLMNSNPFQIFLLIISVLEIALIFFAAVDAIRHKIEHRILWVLLSLLGIISLGINVGPDQFLFRFFLGMATNYSALIRYGGSYFTFRLMLPVGAVVYLLCRRKLLSSIPPETAPENAPLDVKEEPPKE